MCGPFCMSQLFVTISKYLTQAIYDKKFKFTIQEVQKVPTVQHRSCGKGSPWLCHLMEDSKDRKQAVTS